MAKKIPADAFDAYFAQGTERSYQTLATKYGVTKKAITLAAKRERWQQRILELEAKAREASDKKKSESLEERNNRHLQEFRFLEAKAVKALREYPIKNAADAERALQLAVHQQRIISGDPSDRTAISIEDTIKREYERWMLSQPEAEPTVEKEDDAQDNLDGEDAE